MSSIISLLDFLLLLGAGVPESGMVEVDLTWKEKQNGKMSMCTTAVLLNLGLRTKFLQIFSVYMFGCVCAFVHMFS